MVQDFAKFDSSRSKVQYIDERNHFDLYIVHWKSLIGFLQNPHVQGGAKMGGIHGDKHEAILDAAYTVFGTKGFYESKISEIAEQAGVAKRNAEGTGKPCLGRGPASDGESSSSLLLQAQAAYEVVFHESE
jgi:hypothetical protein